MIAGRLLSILMLLQARGRMTAAALAEALEVSNRTVLRDIDQLSAAGVPLWGARGRDGGFQLRDGWSTQLTGMTEAEAHALLLAGLPAAATELGLGVEAASARVKLVASLPPPWRGQADRMSQRLHIDPVEWYRARDTPHFLHAVADAVWHGRSVDVEYESWRGKAHRALDPLGLVLKAGAWYVVARTSGGDAVRTYRLASLRSLAPRRTTFKRPRRFDLAQYWQQSAARFESELRTIPARVRVSPRGARWLANARVPMSASEPEPSDTPLRRGWRDVRIAVESIAEGARHLASYGAELEVLAPTALRTRVLRHAAALVAMYARPPSLRRGRSATQ